jgi:hypothetical protein
MKGQIIIIVMTYFTLLISCKGTTVNNCNENLDFKKVFMDNITNVENYTLGNETDKTKFNSGIIFLSKYTSLSYEKILNYSFEYVDINAFHKDKVVWLKWYNDNKCSNIQFKNTKNVGEFLQLSED